MGLESLYQSLDSNLDKVPQSIEEVQEQDEFVRRVVGELDKVSYDQERYLEILNHMDKQSFRLSSEEQNRRWKIFGSKKNFIGKLARKKNQLNMITGNLKLECQVEMSDFENKVK